MEAVRVIIPERIIVNYPSKYGELKLAATNIVFGKYIDDQGKEKRGWTAALSMMLGDNPETGKAFKVNAGKSIRFDQFTVDVLRIDRSRMGMFVFATISTEDKS